MNKELDSPKFICQAFLTAYADTFARNFVSSCKNALPGTLSEDKLLFVGTELFQKTFLPEEGMDHFASVRTAFDKIIKCTDKAYIILSHTWLMMAKDVIDCLLRQDSKFSDLELFLNRINELSELLLDTYFEKSQNVPEPKFDVDITTKKHKEIVRTFSRYLNVTDTKESSDELIIHTYYRSIPVELSATVLKVDTASVTFNLHPYQAVALASKRLALIKSSFHNHVFQAFSEHVDIQGRTAVLSHFSPHNYPLERRAHIRVEPKKITKIRIVHNNYSLCGRIDNFSEVAIAVYVKNIDEASYKKGTTVQLIAEVPAVHDMRSIQIDVTGSITNVYCRVRGDADAYRIIIHWEINPGLKSKLSQYISERQGEVLRELKELSQEQNSDADNAIPS